MHKILFAVLILMLVGCARAAQPTVLLDPDFKLDGRSYADLSAEWWQWAMSSPEETNPVSDTSGLNCDVGQNGNVWFLAGGFGSSKIKRNCVIPAGKYIFFPVINIANWRPENDTTDTCEKVKAQVQLDNQNALDLFLELDGVAVTDIKRYRAATEKCFNIFEKVPSDLYPYNAYPSASDGYWILFQPLEDGMHTLKFGGRYNFGDAEIIQDIEYEIFVPGKN